MKKEDLLEIEKKIAHNEELVEKNEKTISENAQKIEEIFKKLEKYSSRIKQNSFALEIIRDNNRELDNLIKTSKMKNIIILIETIVILGLAAIVIAHHWK